MFRPAGRWEYRWKFCILLLSQSLLGMLACGVFGSPGEWYAPEFSRFEVWLAVGLTTIGLAMRLGGTSSLSSEVMASTDPETTSLVASGPYEIVRNPLYLGTIFIMSGLAAFFGWPFAAAAAVFHWVRYDRVVLYEERLLKSELGEAYRSYTARVSRWLPGRFFSGLRTTQLNWQSIPSNGFFAGAWLGTTLAAVTGHFHWMIPAQLAGGLTMAAWFAMAGRVAPAENVIRIPSSIQPELVRVQNSQRSDSTIPS